MSVVHPAISSRAHADATHSTHLDLCPNGVCDDHRAGKIVVDLIGRVNKCGVISPRFDVGSGELEQWVVNLLPARQFGHILLTTSYGIMDHEEAKRKHTGGKVLGFFY